MDVQQHTSRERVFSILNDNDCPSFVIRPKSSTPASKGSSPTRLPSISSLSPRLERPHILRQSQYQRNLSVSSAGSPPLLRYDSSSSKSSNSSMDSTPSPITPAYAYNDSQVPSYDTLLRGDLGPSYMPSSTTLTPFLDQQMMLGPSSSAQLMTFEPKAAPVPPTYPLTAQADLQQLPTPSLSNQNSISSNSTSSGGAQAKSTQANAQALTGKKNKYPCPYAASHNCLATFTTSGHAARHGKKHTGEKGVHCPICNKAFTRKDNMKQHERTHKNKNATDETRSKAAITKEAQKAKGHKKTDSEATNHTRRTSLIQSPRSEATSLAPNTIDTPINVPEPNFYQDPSPPMMMLPTGSLSSDVLMPSSLYPPLGDETLLPGPMDKMDPTGSMPPTLIRGFSDLDTLAQVAESFDPYYHSQF